MDDVVRKDNYYRFFFKLREFCLLAWPGVAAALPVLLIVIDSGPLPSLMLVDAAAREYVNAIKLKKENSHNENYSFI